MSVCFFLFFFSCLRFSLRAGPACGGLSDGQKEELSAEPGVWDEPMRDRFARVNCDGWRCFVWRLKIWLNERMLSTADTGSGNQKGRVKSEISLSSFPHCQHIYSPVPRVQYKTKHVILVFLAVEKSRSANIRTKNRKGLQWEKKSDSSLRFYTMESYICVYVLPCLFFTRHKIWRIHRC